MIHRPAVRTAITAVTLAIAGAVLATLPHGPHNHPLPVESARAWRPVELPAQAPSPPPNLELPARAPSLRVDLLRPALVDEIAIAMPTGICGVGCEGPCELEVSADGVTSRHQVIPSRLLQYNGDDDVIYWGSGNPDQFEVTVIDRRTREVLFSVRRQHDEPSSPLNWIEVIGNEVTINYTQFMAMGRLPEHTQETYDLRTSKLLRTRSSQLPGPLELEATQKMTTVSKPRSVEFTL